MTDKPLKSSLELAMERLKKKDADEGVESVPLTDGQKADIAEARNFYEAKIAEQGSAASLELCSSGMKWKESGAAAVLSLRCLTHTTERWDQFWAKIDRWGFPVAV